MLGILDNRGFVLPTPEDAHSPRGAGAGQKEAEATRKTVPQARGGESFPKKLCTLSRTGWETLLPPL